MRHFWPQFWHSTRFSSYLLNLGLFWWIFKVLHPFEEIFYWICVLLSFPKIKIGNNFGFGSYRTMLCFYIGDLFKCLLSLTHCLFCFLQLKSAKDPESTSSGHSPDLTLTSRPMSEESSLWDDTDTEVRRRQNKVHQVSYSFFFLKIIWFFFFSSKWITFKTKKIVVCEKRMRIFQLSISWWHFSL